jgi:hypothetical protein
MLTEVEIMETIHRHWQTRLDAWGACEIGTPQSLAAGAAWEAICRLEADLRKHEEEQR